ncbi:outer membrane protein [Pelagibacterium limicola]|uniref:outer membrane protein n=1 Tax=Pelagibacterium limicola TaxID=2791022 RepID=UPI0018AFAF88|nr:outer membrane protein [Pelagibacterium limicola]
MNRTLLVSAALVAFASPALAADPMRPVPVPSVPVVDTSSIWDGFYAGFHVGYGRGEAYDAGGVISFAGSDYDSISGFFGGVQIGANVQSGSIVFGLETDISLSGLSQTIVDGGGNDVIVGLDYFGTVRARVGVDLDGVLPYLTAGFAYGQGYLDDTDAGFARDTNFHTGWTVGAGVEFAVSDSMSIKGEYLYTDLGIRSYPAAGLGGPWDAGVRFHTIKLGANFHF